MSTALALYRAPLSARRPPESLVPLISSLIPRRERLLFAFLHLVRRMMVQQGIEPGEVEAKMAVDRYDQPGALVMWWRSCAREYLARRPRRTDHPPDAPWPPVMMLANDDEIATICVALAHYIDVQSPAYPWYCDGWRESVAWCVAGCPIDAQDRAAAAARVASAVADKDRFAALDAEGRLDAEPIVHTPPTLRVVQNSPPPAGPLFDGPQPDLCPDLEAELYGDEPEPWEGY